GIGYGLPINTAKNFLGHMRAGIFCDHATLGATVNTQLSEEGDVSRLVVNSILDESDAARRGLAEGDEVLNFAGREIRTANKLERDRVLANAKKVADYGMFTGDWVWTGSFEREGRGGDFTFKMEEVKEADGKNTHPKVTVQLGLADYHLEPQRQGLTTTELS